MSQIRRRIALLSGVALPLTGVAIWLGTSATAAAPKTVGVAPTGQTTQELVGRVHQDIAAFTEYGYLTHLAGLPDAALFSDPAQRDEAHARFTFYAQHTLSARSVIDTLFALTIGGRTTMYFTAKPSRNAQDPASFAKGTKIATYSVRGHDILNVQAPNQGIATATASFAQTQAGTFALAGKQYRFGTVGFNQRLAATGEGKRSSINPLVSDIAIAGDVVATG
jgi:hypothetical protein